MRLGKDYPQIIVIEAQKALLHRALSFHIAPEPIAQSHDHHGEAFG